MKLRELSTVFFGLVVAASLALALATVSGCVPKDENGQEMGKPRVHSGDLDPKVAELFDRACARLESTFLSDFYWRSPVALASQAIYVEQFNVKTKLRYDFSQFIEYIGKKDDPLAKDLAELCTSPYELYKVSSTDKLIRARLYCATGKTDEIRKLFWPDETTPGSDAPSKPSGMPDKTKVSADEWAVWVLANARFLVPPEYAAELTAIADKPDGLEDSIRLAVLTKYAENAAWDKKSLDEIRKILDGAYKDQNEREAILGRILNRANRFDEADMVLAGYLRVVPYDPRALVERSLSALGHGEPSKADDYLQKALSYNGLLSEAHTAMGTANYLERKLPEALEHFETAYDIDPYVPALYPQWARTLSELGRVTEARDQLDRGILLFPDYFQLRMVSGQVYEAFGDLDKSLADFSASASLAPGIPHSYLEMGSVLVRLGRSADAISNFDKAEKLGLPVAEVEAVWGRASLAMKDYAAASTHLAKAAAIRRKDAGIHSDLAKAYAGAGKKLEAAREYEAAVSKNSYDQDSAVQGALMYAQAGKVDDSLKMLNKAVDAGWRDTDYIVSNFPDAVKNRHEFKNIMANMDPAYGK